QIGANALVRLMTVSSSPPSAMDEHRYRARSLTLCLPKIQYIRGMRSIGHGLMGRSCFRRFGSSSRCVAFDIVSLCSTWVRWLALALNLDGHRCKEHEVTRAFAPFLREIFLQPCT